MEKRARSQASRWNKLAPNPQVAPHHPGHGEESKLGGCHMIKVVLGFLLALSVSSLAITIYADGSMTLTQDEVDNVERNLQKIQTERDYAMLIILQLQKKMEAMEKGKCV
jgi:hypothetical protein